MTTDLRTRLLAHAAVHDACTSEHSDEQAQWARDLREAAALVAPAPCASPAEAPAERGRPALHYPAGYCLDPNGRMCIPEGKAEDWNFGYECGYREAMAVKQPVGRAGPAAAGVQGEVAFWVLREQLEARETTCNGRMWFSDPVNSAWVPVFLHSAPAVERGVAEEREAFEATMRRDTFDTLERVSNGDYRSYEARVGWIMWLARAALSTAGKEQA